MLPADIKNLIIAEQALQSGALVRGVSVEDYVQKTQKSAEFLIHYTADSCLGFVAFYCNDFESKRGYITMVLISEPGRGKGVAKQLVIGVLNTMRSRGYQTCGLEVLRSNHSAYNLYVKCGFLVVNETEEVIKMSVNL
ncbi:GNAT family N-acetyltransferase [Pseudomonas sp. PAMC 25886]|uniref:GNAT family N-acetyltransferase n=1 Tax=Pseudomonas sp. PAMC 25886 TaxID=1125977 RepID=UPI001300C0E7|nr:GNAT family N-acetyltransferase [Pseudomonas sp. PAMC 25886]